MAKKFQLLRLGYPPLRSSKLHPILSNKKVVISYQNSKKINIHLVTVVRYSFRFFLYKKLSGGNFLKRGDQKTISFENPTLLGVHPIPPHPSQSAQNYFRQQKFSGGVHVGHFGGRGGLLNFPVRGDLKCGGFGAASAPRGAGASC